MNYDVVIQKIHVCEGTKISGVIIKKYASNPLHVLQMVNPERGDSMWFFINYCPFCGENLR